ncbi:hypothetical protein SAMN05421858_3818 [Haladaptatus litoreus]|uniref:Uncharacterized protein n=2 Tax=Haladaptatus litoreus TaxID=553468 RepID=A0A1N7DX19_9EURY|nr:hypothetical protein SAMN05421858_3818 [Haladaptatus litoreus]
MNFDDEPHTVHVLLYKDGETAYRKSLRLEAGRSDDPSESKFGDYPAESGADVLYAWRDDQSEEQRRELDFSEYETECIGFKVLVGNIDEPTPRVSIWQTTNCNAGT